MRLTLPRERYPGERPDAFFDQLVERLGGACPACARCRRRRSSRRSAVFAHAVRARAAGSPTGETLPTAQITTSPRPSYFDDAARAAARRARHSAPTDRLDAPPVAIVNQAFADRYLPGRRSDRPAARDRQPGSAAAMDDDRRRRGRLPEQRPRRSPCVPRSTSRSGSRRSGTSCSCSSAPTGRRPACCRPSRADGRRRSIPSSRSTAIQTMEEAVAHVVVPAAHRRDAAVASLPASRSCWRRSASTA